MDSINSALDLKNIMDNLPAAVIVIDQNSMLLKLKEQILRISVIVNNILNIDEYRTRNYINDE